MSWACGYGQHVLDKHDNDILPHLNGWRPCQPSMFEIFNVDRVRVQIFGAFPTNFINRKIFPLDLEFLNAPYKSSDFSNPVG